MLKVWNMTNPQLNDLLEKSAILHNHLCPRQVLGVRMGIYGAELLSLPYPQTNKRLYAIVETDGCFADGVASATGCTLGHRTMRLMDYGKVAASFVDTKTNKAVRIRPRLDVRQQAEFYANGCQSRWHTQLEAYQKMPVDILLEATPIDLTISMTDIISRPGIRVNCATCGEEIINEREVIRDNQIYCQACVGQGYYKQELVALTFLNNSPQ